VPEASAGLDGVCADAPRPGRGGPGAPWVLPVEQGVGDTAGSEASPALGPSAAMAPLRGWADQGPARPGPAAFPAPAAPLPGLRVAVGPHSAGLGDLAAAPGPRLASGGGSAARPLGDEHGRRPGRPARRVSGGARAGDAGRVGGAVGPRRASPRRTPRPHCGSRPCGPRPLPLGTGRRLRKLPEGTPVRSLLLWVPTFSRSCTHGHVQKNLLCLLGGVYTCGLSPVIITPYTPLTDEETEA
jgi:hypothetical protein